MAKIQLLDYTIYLTDAEKVKEYGFAGELRRRYNLAPTAAATLFQAPIQQEHEIFAAPCIRSSWFRSGENFPLDVATFRRRSGGFWGWLSQLWGNYTDYYWMGHFEHHPLAEPGEPVEGQTAPMARRRWIDSFSTYEGSIRRSYAASIDPGTGTGLSLRKNVGNTGGYSHQTDEDGGEKPYSSWERLYVRIRHYPSQPAPLWECRGTSGTNGARIQVLPTGQLAYYNGLLDISDKLLGTTDSLELERWYKVDLLIQFRQPDSASGRLRCYLNGHLEADLVVSSGGGLANEERHSYSILGKEGANDFEADYDSWICADLPVGSGGEALLNGIDWRHGSRVVPLYINSWGDQHNGAAWEGDWRNLTQHLMSILAGGYSNGVESATISQTLHATFDLTPAIAQPGSLGAAALAVKVLHNRVIGAGTWSEADLGYSLNGGPLNSRTFTGYVGLYPWEAISHFPEVAEPFQLTSLEAQYCVTTEWSGATATPYRVHALVALVELVGIFGPEDVPADASPDTPPPAPKRLQTHNAPYPRTPWVLSQSAPPCPVAIYGGTYGGNGTGQDLAFPVPIQWLWIRRLDAASGPEWWTSSMLWSHEGDGDTQTPGLACVLMDPTCPPATEEGQAETRALVRLYGDNARLNAPGNTYQFIAFADPGARFCLNGAFAHASQLGADGRNKLEVLGFLPEAGWFQKELPYATGSYGYYKGPGYALAAASQIHTGSEIASVVTFAQGEIISHAELHSGYNQVAYSLWRRDDGSGDPGAAAVVKIGHYVGDGAASRTIGLTPPCGRRPLFAYVRAHANSNAVIRDPSHTDTSSSQVSGSSISTGITSGGIDQFTVGSTLNANGVTYDYFAFMGGSDAGNNGWSQNGEYVPVEPDYVPDSPYEEPLEPDEFPTWPPDGGGDPGTGEPPGVIIPPGLEDDLTECPVETHRLINIALARIGVSKRVEALSTETSIEADMVRLHYDDDVEATLRDFPWPWATRYATLVASAQTQPHAGDWTEAYLSPGDCVFERRLVAERGRAADPTPPPFRLVAANNGVRVVLCNVEAPAVLEYTARVICPAKFGDPAWRDAFAWRLAASLAPALSRISDRAKECMVMYEAVLTNVRSVIQPGSPGPAPLAPQPDTVDVAAGDVAANLHVVNRALLRLGARTIASVSDQSRESVAANMVFEEELRSTLRDFPWPFATAYADPVLVAGSADAWANADWTFSYRLPADCLFVRRLVTPAVGRDYDPNPPRYRVAQDATGGLLYTHFDAPTIEYTARVPGTVAQADALFRDALSWRLAAALAPSQAYADPEGVEQLGRGPRDARGIIPGQPAAAEDQVQSHAWDRRDRRLVDQRQRVADACWRRYYMVLDIARASSAKEQQQAPTGDPDWITGRN